MHTNTKAVHKYVCSFVQTNAQKMRPKLTEQEEPFFHISRKAPYGLTVKESNETENDQKNMNGSLRKQAKSKQLF